MKICFVCTGNYYRSRFAEAVFNFMASNSDLKISAESRGLNISAADQLAEKHGELSLFTLDMLNKLSIDKSFTHDKRRRFSINDINKFDKFIFLDKEEHTSMLYKVKDIDNFDIKKKIVFWNVKDVFDWKPEKTLSTILLNVTNLFNSIVWKGV